MEENKSRVEKFFSSVVIPAFQEAKKELERRNKNISVYIGPGVDMEKIPLISCLSFCSKVYPNEKP